MQVRKPARTPAQDRALRWLGLILVALLSIAIFYYGPQISQLGGYGYPGLFLINLAASATLILPAPGIALAFAAGAHLNPFLVGVAVGLGSAIGELTGYLAGISGRAVVGDSPRMLRVQHLMRSYGLLVIFALSLVPNPLFDVAGITAGAMRMPVWQFLLAATAGKTIKAALLAFAGAGMMGALAPAIREWLAR
jgi:membrane protein YqaA with SNARE-associated domain